MLIVTQERSSSKRKEMWKTVQSRAGNPRPVQLLLDMKVRWSSTYLMLDRAERNKAVSTYVHMNLSTIGIHFFSPLIFLSMNYAGKRLIFRNVTKSVHSNWITMNGSGSTRFWAYYLYVSYILIL